MNEASMAVHRHNEELRCREDIDERLCVWQGRGVSAEFIVRMLRQFADDIGWTPESAPPEGE